MGSASTPWFPALLGQLLERQELSAAQVTRVFDAILSGQLGEAEVAAFLVAMRCKGESAGELAAAAAALRAAMVPLETGRDDVLDTCGPGGTNRGTFNISTAAAIVAAGAGVPVVKHGNRAVSGRCGSADVLAELGVSVESGVDWARRCLDRAGFAFCLAPLFHPALKHVAALRRRIGVRTMLNLLGPLANPANAAFQLVGVGRADLLDPIAQALVKLGTRNAYVVYAADGLDEVSLGSVTYYRNVQDGRMTPGEWTARDFDLEGCSPSEIQASDASQSAQIIRSVLQGEVGPARRFVLANAAAAIHVAGKADDLRHGVQRAAESIDSGRAARVLTQMKSIEQ
jgi:anthranilate phosphoribosyltransferase